MKITNYERIKQMPFDEMAHYIAHLKGCGITCPAIASCNRKKRWFCLREIKQWLLAEVTNE